MDKLQELRALVRSGNWNAMVESDQQKGIPAPPIWPVVAADEQLIPLPSPDTCPVKQKGFLDIVRDRLSKRKYETQGLAL